MTTVWIPAPLAETMVKRVFAGQAPVYSGGKTSRFYLVAVDGAGYYR